MLPPPRSYAMCARAGLALTLFVCLAAAGFGQQPAKSAKTAKVANTEAPASVNGYFQPKRDPFEIPARRPHKVEPPPQVKPVPSLQERLRQYAELRNRLRAEGRPAPSAVAAYLVSEIEVNGVFKDKEGYGAFVTAKPTNSTFFVRLGGKVFNGSVEKIEPQEVRFREITWMTTGKDVFKDVMKPILPAGK